MDIVKLKIAEDFSPKLGGRYKRLGTFSGELFYEQLLLLKYNEAKRSNSKLYVFLDGAKPYGSSFLDESFGKLYRETDKNDVVSRIEFQTEYYNWIVEYIKNEIWK